MIHQYKVELQERIKKWERENNMKIIENNMRREKKRKKTLNYLGHVILCNKITLYSFML